MNANFTFGKNIFNRNAENQLLESLEQLADIIRNPDQLVIDANEELKSKFISAFNIKGLIEGSEAFKTYKRVYITSVKESLPYFIFAGYCPFHHSNESLQLFNGCVQADFDFKFKNGNLKAIEFKNRLIKDPFVKLACISPSGFGVKCIIQTTAPDKEFYKEAEEQVRQYFYATYGEIMDELSVSIPCFVPYDPEVYINPDAQIFEYREVKQEKKKYTNSAAGSSKESALQEFIANLQQQEVAWDLWYKLAYSLYNLFGEDKAREYFDVISQKSSKYEKKFTNSTFRNAIKSRRRNCNRERQAGWTTICEFAKEAGYELKVEPKARKASKTINVDEYVAEILDMARDGLLTATQVRILLEAPTGGGKTFFAAELAKVWHQLDGSITMIAVPLNGIAEQQGKKYKCPFFTSESFNEALEQLNYNRESTPFVFSNYDNAVRVVEILKAAGKIVNLIIDEQHELINGYNYRMQVVSNLYQASKGLNRVIMMSATPFMEGFENYYHLKVTTKKVNLAPYHLVKSRIAIVKATLAEIKKKKTKAIVLMQSGKRIEELKKACEENKLRVATIYNDGETDNPTYNYLMEHESLPDNIDILLCTSKIATGINIEAKEKTRMIYAETVVVDNKPVFNLRLCKQFFARIRNTEMAEYIAIVLDNSKYERKPFNTTAFFYASKERYTKRAKELTDDPTAPLEAVMCDFSEWINMYIKQENGTVTLNDLALMYLVMAKEIRNGDPDLLADEYQIFEDISDEDALALAQAAYDLRKIQIETEKQVYELFMSSKKELAGAIYKKTKDKKLKKFLSIEYNAKYWQANTNIILTDKKLIEVTEIAFKRDMRVSELRIRDDERHKLIFDRQKKLAHNGWFGRTYNAFAIHLALEGVYTAELDKKQVKQYKKVKKALLLAFRKDKCLTSVAIMQIVNRYFTAYKTKTKTTQFAEIFFTLQRQKIGAEQIYYFYKGVNLRRLCRNLGLNFEQLRSYNRKEKNTPESVQKDCPTMESPICVEDTLYTMDNSMNEPDLSHLFNKINEPIPF